MTLVCDNRPAEPKGDQVAWYRGWEAGYDDMAARYTEQCWIAYKGGCDLDAPQVSAVTWDALLDEIDAAEGERVPACCGDGGE